MVSVVVSTRLESVLNDVSAAMDDGALTPSGIFADRLSALAAAFDASEPHLDRLSSAAVQLSVPVPGTAAQRFSVTLSGTGFAPVGSFDALMTAIENGLANGTFTQLTLKQGTTTLASIRFAHDSYTLTSGNEVFTLRGALPTNFHSLAELADLLGQLSPENLSDMSSAQRTAFFDNLGDFGLTGLQLTTSASGTPATVFNLQVSEGAITLSNAMISIALTGTFPTDFGAMAEIAYQVWEQQFDTGTVDLDQISGLGIDGLEIRNGAGTVLLDIGGPISDDMTFDLVLRGTTGTDVVNLDETAFYDPATTSTAIVDLGAGNDHLIFGAQAFFESDGAEMAVTLRGGLGDDVLEVDDGTYWDTTDSVVINLLSHTISGRHDGSTASEWTVRYSGFETLAFGADEGTVVGTTGADVLRLTGTAYDDWTEPSSYLLFRGGAGADTLDLSQMLWYDAGHTLHEGITLAQFIAAYSGVATATGVLRYLPDSGNAPQIDLSNVEYLRFATTAGGTQRVSVLATGVGQQIGATASFMGTSAPDAVIGGSGANLIRGYGGNDSLFGAAGDDSINGGTENDLLSGGLGRDLLVGGTGADTLSGGNAADTLSGGTGADVFVFETTPGATGIDLITDFVAADDTIWLDRGIFTRLSLGALTGAAFAANTTGQATQLDDRIIYETDTGNLYYDANGSGAGARVQLATLTGHPGLSATDFLVI